MSELSEADRSMPRLLRDCLSDLARSGDVHPAIARTIDKWSSEQAWSQSVRDAEESLARDRAAGQLADIVREAPDLVLAAAEHLRREQAHDDS